MLIIESVAECAMGTIYFPEPEETSPYYNGEVEFVSEVVNANSIDRWGLSTFSTDPIFDHNLPLSYDSGFPAPSRGIYSDISPSIFNESISSRQSSNTSYDYIADPVYDPVCDPVCTPVPLIVCV
jgi:hypothetical protein